MAARALVVQIGKWAVVFALAVTVGLASLMATMRRDHKVELVVTYPKSSPAAVWRLLTDHAAEPTWLPAFSTVTRQPDIGGQAVWSHTSSDHTFTFTLRTLSMIPERRYERLLVRDDQPRNESWDGRWVYELEPHGDGTILRITEYGWTDGIPFFIMQRVVANPDGFLKYYANMIGKALGDPPAIQVVRSH